jgi:hypothetical protein
VAFLADLKAARAILREHAEELIQRSHDDETLGRAEAILNLADRLTADAIPNQ